MGDLELGAAVEAGGDALYDDLFEFGLNGTDASNAAEKCLAAALPHVRRAVIEELVAKAKAEAAGQYDPYRIRSVEANYALGWLRDELEEGDGCG